MSKQRIAILSSLVLVVAGGFYWMSARPYLDRKYCNDYAASKVDAYDPSSDRAYTMYTRHYSLCLASHGLGE